MTGTAEFQHVTPELRIHAGRKSLGQLPRELDRIGSSKAVVMCGSTLGQPGSPLDQVREVLGERLAGVFTGVRAHSPVPDVEAATAFLREREADAVIAVGGGSAIVTARAASILLAESGKVTALCTTFENGRPVSPRLEAPKLPQFVIPTTPTTAMAKAGSALSDPDTHSRLALFDPKTRARCLFVHPDMLATAPRRLVVSASLNTLSMAVEGLMSLKGDPIADSQLMHALRLCERRLRDEASLDTAEARSDLVIAALLCGQGTDHSGAGLTTVLGHAIGAHHNVENGTVNAIVLPHVLRFNESSTPEGLCKIADALSAVGTKAVLYRLRSLFAALGVPATLGMTGVAKADLPAIATRAMGDWFLKGNPRTVADESELITFMENAW